jgi:hypothetical protein
MAKVKIKTNENGEMCISYNCECGSPIELHTYIKPKRLPKCFDCNIYCPPIDWSAMPDKNKNKKTNKRYASPNR